MLHSGFPPTFCTNTTLCTGCSQPVIKQGRDTPAGPFPGDLGLLWWATLAEGRHTALSKMLPPTHLSSLSLWVKPVLLCDGFPWLPLHFCSQVGVSLFISSCALTCFVWLKSHQPWRPQLLPTWKPGDQRLKERPLPSCYKWKVLTQWMQWDHCLPLCGQIA